MIAERLAPREVFVGRDFHFGKGRAGSGEMLAARAPALGHPRRDPLAGARGRRRRVEHADPRGARARRVDEANLCLGRPYTIWGRVVEGDRRGRTLGFPTANLAPENEIAPAERRVRDARAAVRRRRRARARRRVAARGHQRRHAADLRAGPGAGRDAPARLRRRPVRAPARARVPRAHPRGAALLGTAGAGGSRSRVDAERARELLRGASARGLSEPRRARRALRFAHRLARLGRRRCSRSPPSPSRCAASTCARWRRTSATRTRGSCWRWFRCTCWRCTCARCAGAGWRARCRSEPLPIRPLFRATALGFMAINVLPLRLGELARPWLLGRETEVRGSAALGTLVLERAIDFTAVVADGRDRAVPAHQDDAGLGALGRGDLRGLHAGCRWRRSSRCGSTSAGTLALLAWFLRPFPEGARARVMDLRHRDVSRARRAARLPRHRAGAVPDRGALGHRAARAVPARALGVRHRPAARAR